MAKVWVANEQNTTWLQGFSPEWLPEETFSKVRVFSRRGNEVGLEIGGWVGTVALSNGDTLQINPKFGPTEFFKMLAIAEGVKSPEAETTDLASYSISDSNTSLSMLIRAFLKSLREISSNSLAFTWVENAVYSQSPLSKLNISISSVRMSVGKSDPFLGSRKTRTYDSAVHRILSLAAATLKSQIPQGLASQDYALLTSWSQRGWDRNRISIDLREVKRNVTSGEYSGRRGFYREAAILALMVLTLDGFDIGGKSEAKGAAKLLNSADIFEKFVRTTIGEFVNPRGFYVHKELPNFRYLFDGGIAGLEPDVLISKGNAVVFVGDVKYKNVGNPDYFQMLSYLDHYGLSEGFIVTLGEKDQSKPIVLSTPNGVTIRVLTLNPANVESMRESLRRIPEMLGF